jgi:putative ABC transport system substrate-binding protein
MRRRSLAIVLALAFLSPPLVSPAQREARVWSVGFLAARQVDSLDSDPVYGAFPRGLRDLGYVEGRNVVIQWRSAGGKYERLPGLATELVQLQVDVIVAAGAPAISAAQKATTTIPIVMGTTGDPVGSGFIRSLARPGGNITGLSDLVGDLGSKYLDMLLRTVPKLSHVAVLTNPGNSSHAAILASVEATARGAGAKVLHVTARSPQEIESAFSTIVQRGARAAIVTADPLFNQQHRQIADLAAKHRLPAVSGYRQYVYAGGLMNYGADFADNFRRAAAYVDRILKGARPADLPVEQATRFQLAVNLKTARALGLTIPPSVLAGADEVIQ